MSSYVWISSGRSVSVDPTPNEFERWNISDVAHALAGLARWTGHCRAPFSVAQHSVIVSYLVPKGFELEGLFHDAAEWVLGDISTPLKRLFGEETLREYRTLTRAWDETLARRFCFRPCFEPDVHPVIKHADRTSQYWEAKLLVNVAPRDLRVFALETPGYTDWGKDETALKRLPSSLEVMFEPLPFREAKRAFLRRYLELTEHRRYPKGPV